MKEAWLQTRSGIAFSLAPVRARDVRRGDIAHSLGRICRFNGMVREHYSVAEHCWLIARYLEPLLGPKVAFAGLLHDAHEAYCSDLPYPVQQTMSPEALRWWRGLQAEIDVAICAATDGVLTPDDLRHPAIKQADLRILVDERDALLGASPIPWAVDDLGALGVEIRAWSAETATRNWNEAFDALWRQVST